MKAHLATAFAFLLLGLLAAWAIRLTGNDPAALAVVQYQPQGIMGTACKLVLVADPDQKDFAKRQLESAEAELRRLEALLSTWIERSEMSRVNLAPADQPLEVAAEVLDVLVLARDFHSASEGAFDITARPLVELWRMSATRDQPPSQEELEAARRESTWDHLRIQEHGVVKTHSTTRVDVDGIAKGYAIDRALEILQGSGLAGGLVEVGGDLRVFGAGPDGNPWRIAIRSPFDARPWAEIELRQGAVCSSGDYARFIDIDGRRFSHIIDPRSGQPSEASRSVTVVAPTATTADAWATALSILGAAGLELLPADEGLEAMIVTGETDDFSVQTTPGFHQLLVWADFEPSDRATGGC